MSLKNMKEPPDPGDKPWATYQCIKTSLKSVVKDDIVVSKLMEAALRTNSIMIHTLQLLKLYLIHCYDIQCSPQDYLPLMLYMMKTIEAHGTSVPYEARSSQNTSGSILYLSSTSASPRSRESVVTTRGRVTSSSTKTASGIFSSKLI